jgi:hypothetical protein
MDQRLLLQKIASLERRIIELERRPKYPARPGGGGAGGASVKFGVATETWESGNALTLDPSSQDGTDNGLPNVLVDVVSPGNGAPPPHVAIAAGDIVAYFPYPTAIGGSAGIVVNVNQAPTPTAKYQVQQCTDFTSATDFAVDYDYVRGAP